MPQSVVPPLRTLRMPYDSGKIDWWELWRYRDLIWMLVRRDFSLFYKQTLLGPLWYLLQPVLTMLVFTAVFHRMAELSSGGVPAPLFNLVGILMWGFFRDTFIGVSETFVRHQALFSKVYFPRLVVPLAEWGIGLIRLGFQWIILLGLWLFWVMRTDGIPTFQWGWFSFAVLLLSMAGVGGGLLMASLMTKYRDLRFVVSFGVQLLMFLSAVFYTLDEAAARLPAMGEWLRYNPVAVAIESARWAWLGVGSVSWEAALVAFTGCGVVLAVGIYRFNRAEKDFLDTI